MESRLESGCRPGERNRLLPDLSFSAPNESHKSKIITRLQVHSGEEGGKNEQMDKVLGLHHIVNSVKFISVKASMIWIHNQIKAKVLTMAESLLPQFNSCGCLPHPSPAATLTADLPVVTGTSQACCYLRAFALAASTAWSTLSPHICLACSLDFSRFPLRCHPLSEALPENPTKMKSLFSYPRLSLLPFIFLQY